MTVEFFRLKTSDCTHDDSGNPISPNAGDFPYGTSCNITCSVEEGPFSPLRGGSANNIYVIPVPDRLTFGMASLLAAACCIPAIIWLVSMVKKILVINWKICVSSRDPSDYIEGTNGATDEKMEKINGLINLFLRAVEVPVLSAIAFAILIIGERNFSSVPVRYQIEPMTTIGR